LDSTTFGFIALAIGVSYFLTAVAKVVARRTGMLDRPDGRRKSHGEPMPLLGGLAVFLSLATCIGVAHWWRPWELLTDDGETQSLIQMLLISGGLYCAIGLYDDRCGL